MKPDQLKTIDIHGVSFDTETYLLRPGNLVPPLVLGSVAWYDGQEIKGQLLTKEQTLELFAQIIEDVDKIIIGANLAFDLAVLVREFAIRGLDILPYIFRALMGDHTELMTGIHDGRIFDIQHSQALDAIANGMLGKDPRTGAQLKGRYSQDQVIQLLFDRDDAKKNDEYRLRYGEFDGVPLEQLPETAQQYPVDDVVNAMQAAFAQTGFLPKLGAFHTWGTKGCCVDCGSTGMGSPCWVRRPHLNQHDLAAQTATAFCLHMGAATGFRIDQSYVDIIEKHSSDNRIVGLKPYIEAGLIRPDGTENRSELKRLVAVAYGSTGKCLVCNGTGKVPSPANPKSKIICFRPGELGEKIKTCDGTGLVLSGDVPRSEKEGIGYGRSFLTESGDEFLMEYAEVLEDQKILNVYVPFLRTARLCISCEHNGTDKDPHSDGCVMAGWKDIPLTLRPNPILDTKRVSYDGAVMLLPRKVGYLDNKTGRYIPSLRETFRARDGWGYSSEDFKAGETFTHAQSCIWLLGYSDLGTALLNDVDPHGAVAASVLGVSYEEWFRRRKEPLFKAARQAAKPTVFGKPTGMSSVKIVQSSRAQGPDTPCERGPSWIDDGTNTGNKIRGYKGLRYCILMNGAKTCGDVKVTKWGFRDKPISPTCKECLECGDHIGNIWLGQFRENKPYYDKISEITEDGQVVTYEMLELWPWLQDVYTEGFKTEPGQIIQHWSGTLRGGCNFTTACNGYFQTLLADITKLAYRMVARECYDSTVKVPTMMFHNSLPSRYAGARSPLYGSKPLAPWHDEIFAEHPKAMLVDGAQRISEVMRDVFAYVCPDMAPKVGADPTIQERWYKSAEPVYRNALGELCDAKDPGAILSLWKPKFGPDA